MKDYIIQLIHTVDVFCNLVFWFWVVYYVLHTYQEGSLPNLEKPYAISFWLAFFGVLLIPNQDVLRKIIH